LKNLTLIVFTFIICFFVSEFALRQIGYEPRLLEPNRFFQENKQTTWSEYDEILGWVNREGLSISIEDGSAPMTFWSYGRRATRSDELNISDKINIMLVGGSNAQSYGVRDYDSFPYLINEMFPDVKIENFGTGGYGTVQSLLLARRMLKDYYINSPPDLIILTFADSHIARNVSDSSWIYKISDSNGFYVSPPHYRLDKDGIAFNPFATIKPWLAETSFASLTILHDLWIRYYKYNNIHEGIIVTKRLLNDFSNLAEKNSSNFLVLILEDYALVSEELFMDSNFAVLNCSGYERTQSKEYLLGGGGHPNAKYHRFFSTCLGPWIQNYISLNSLADLR